MRAKQKVFEIFKRERRKGRYPTAKEVADEIGWKNCSGVRDSLPGLVRLGLLVRVKEDGPVMERYEVKDFLHENIS